MNLPIFEFAAIAFALCLLALLILDLLSGAQPVVFVAFVPTLLWGLVLSLKGRK